MPRLADEGSIADELEASSHIHPANDPTAHLYPLWQPPSPDQVESGIAAGLHQAQQAEKGWAAPEQDQPGSTGDMAHAGAVLTLVLAGIVTVCAMAAMARIAWQMWRDREEQGRRTRRLRMSLVIGLQAADGIVA
jgi:heme A synthase